MTDMLESSTAAKKPFSNKAVIAVLLLCGLLTTIAVFASAACYCYKKDKLSVQTITTLSDKETSWNSRINLMSDQSGSFQGFPVKSPIIGKIISMCISYSFFFFFFLEQILIVRYLIKTCILISRSRSFPLAVMVGK